jgi:LPXTG-site transpeptidase (sortase) family protein
VRLVIPTLGVDAPIVAAARDARGNMAAPEGPREVDWYDFTARPGEPGNAVMAGHLNWRDGTVAVFAQLAKVAPGDPVQVIEENGETLHYRVVSVEDIDAFTTDVSTVLDWTAPESLTLITCSGQFVWTAASYSERTVVRAERIADPIT